MIIWYETQVASGMIKVWTVKICVTSGVICVLNFSEKGERQKREKIILIWYTEMIR